MFGPGAEEYEVLFDWDPESSDDLRLCAGDVIGVLEKNDHGWWLGMISRDGDLNKGYFPKNYVKARIEAPKPPPRPMSMLKTADNAHLAPPSAANDSGSRRGSANVDMGDLNKRMSQAKLEIPGPSFSLKTLKAFDELMELGFAVEVEVETGNEKDAGASNHDEKEIQVGQRVELKCSAMIWDGASTITKEFATGVVAFVVGGEQVTAGLDMAVRLLRVGQKATITCAPAMAYGAAGNPPAVPPNSFVVFFVHVLTAQDDKAAIATAAEADGSGTTALMGSGVASRRSGGATPKSADKNDRRMSNRIMLQASPSSTNSSSIQGGGSVVSRPAPPASPSSTDDMAASHQSINSISLNNDIQDP